MDQHRIQARRGRNKWKCETDDVALSSTDVQTTSYAGAGTTRPFSYLFVPTASDAGGRESRLRSFIGTDTHGEEGILTLLILIRNQ